MSRRTRSVLAAIAIWLAIVASTSTAAWIVIDRAGRGAYLSEAAGPGPSAVGPSMTLPTSSGTASTAPAHPRPVPSTGSHTTPTHPSSPATPTSTSPAPSPTPVVTSPTVQPKPSKPPPPTVSDSVSVSGGSVGVSCQASTLTLRFVTPVNGWSYSLKRSSEGIEVSFRRNDGQGESEVHAQCSHGAPTFETSSSGDGRDGSRPE